ncbi:MAG: hypothetical protein APF82_04495 [Sphingomonadales bacterium BRH_c42]|nr:MAG: hypothetical protein APF82_04495 [Sphingomonadales bacterium BRH_c42]
MDRRMKAAWGRWSLLVGLALLAGACSSTGSLSDSKADFTSIESNMRGHITRLASEEFGGRRPGTDGEALTLDYIEGELSRAGYVSGTNDPGNFWRSPVPLVRTMPVSSRIEFRVGRKRTVLPTAQAAAFTGGRRALIEGGEILFVGKQSASVSDEEVRGRIALMLSEPGQSPARRETLFGKGAAAIITVVDDQQSIDQVREFWENEQLGLVSEEQDQLAGFASAEAMEAALGAKKWQALLASAEAPDFAPTVLDATGTIEAVSERRQITSHNLIGRLPGTKPGSGAILLLAHWDHFGQCGDESLEDRLCNGAVDNASGVALMLELARRLASKGQHDRDIYVLATSAEEWGLLGTKAFAENPPLPLESVVAAFNFDTVALAGRGAPVGFVGEGKTPLDAVILDAITRSRREVGDRELADQFLQRQDGWILLQKGVPAVVLSSALGSREVVDPYLTTRYHRPSDDIDGIELGGAVDDLLLHESLIRRLASIARYP